MTDSTPGFPRFFYRGHQGLIKLNVLFPSWNMKPGQSSSGDKNFGLFLIYGKGVVDYTELDYDVFNWTGMSNIFGIGMGMIGTKASTSADFKYSRIDFEETPFSSFQDDHHKAGYFSFHICIYYGFGM